jgi:hypothetical protein
MLPSFPDSGQRGRFHFAQTLVARRSRVSWAPVTMRDSPLASQRTASAMSRGCAIDGECRIVANESPKRRVSLQQPNHCAGVAHRRLNGPRVDGG